MGSIFLNLKLEEKFAERAHSLSKLLWIPNVIAVLAFVIQTYFFTDILQKLGVNPGVVPIGAVISLFITGWLIYQKRAGWAFIMNSLAIVLSTSTIFEILYPRVLVSIIDHAYSLTIYNSASSPYTLKVMSIVALIFVPILIGYQIWSYWVFRKRISSDEKLLHY